MNPSAANNPLAQLRDIHLPAPITWWPPAPGWYMLMALGLIIVGLFAWRAYRRRQQQRFQQTVLTELDSYLHQPSPAWADINLLIKRAAFMHHPRQEVAGLSGEAWLDWLDRQISVDGYKPNDTEDTTFRETQTRAPAGYPYANIISKAYSQGPGRILLTGPYQQHTSSTEDIDQLLKFTITQLLTQKGDACSP